MVPPSTSLSGTYITLYISSDSFSRNDTLPPPPDPPIFRPSRRPTLPLFHRRRRRFRRCGHRSACTEVHPIDRQACTPADSVTRPHHRRACQPANSPTCQIRLELYFHQREKNVQNVHSRTRVALQFKLRYRDNGLMYQIYIFLISALRFLRV